MLAPCAELGRELRGSNPKRRCCSRVFPRRYSVAGLFQACAGTRISLRLSTRLSAWRYRCVGPELGTRTTKVAVAIATELPQMREVPAAAMRRPRAGRRSADRPVLRAFRLRLDPAQECLSHEAARCAETLIIASPRAADERGRTFCGMVQKTTKPPPQGGRRQPPHHDR